MLKIDLDAENVRKWQESVDLPYSIFVTVFLICNLYGVSLMWQFKTNFWRYAKNLCVTLNGGNAGSVCTDPEYNATTSETIAFSLGRLVEVTVIDLRFQGSAPAQIADLKVKYGKSYEISKRGNIRKADIYIKWAEV